MTTAARLLAALILAASPAVLADPTPTTDVEASTTTGAEPAPETADAVIAEAPLASLPSLTVTLRCSLVDPWAVCSDLQDELKVAESLYEAKMLSQAITNLECASLAKKPTYEDCLLMSLGFPRADAEGGEILVETSVWQPETVQVQ
jgi:hypothetical protein